MPRGDRNKSKTAPPELTPAQLDDQQPHPNLRCRHTLPPSDQRGQHPDLTSPKNELPAMRIEFADDEGSETLNP